MPYLYCPLQVKSIFHEVSFFFLKNNTICRMLKKIKQREKITSKTSKKLNLTFASPSLNVPKCMQDLSENHQEGEDKGSQGLSQPSPAPGWVHQTKSGCALTQRFVVTWHVVRGLCTDREDNSGQVTLGAGGWRTSLVCLVRLEMPGVSEQDKLSGERPF